MDGLKCNPQALVEGEAARVRGRCKLIHTAVHPFLKSVFAAEGLLRQLCAMPAPPASRAPSCSKEATTTPRNASQPHHHAR